ncbi:MBL fold metallo-hydrolase [Desulfosarcina sp.]|uniref:MBL fold metallo-hydrolase n=1 Tax=Desulfosarcina sp. TaxID=2027861 RepID=UPI003563BEF7
MKVRFWGTRGSIPKPGSSTVRFGGNTSCVEVRSASGTMIVLDCGTGAHALGQFLMESEAHPLRGHILITHTHWDHIQGIPFFDPLFVPGNEWDIYAPRGLGSSLRESLAGQMQYTYFPITLEELGAAIRYHDLVEGVFEIGDIKVRTLYMNHPALTLGYRLEADGVSVVYACDHEPHSRQYAQGTGTMSEQDRRHIKFMRGADLVIHDAQYTTAEYTDKFGWGHTPVDCAVDMSRAAGVRRLALTHHDPLRSDDRVDALCEEVRASLPRAGRPMDVFAAAEGMVVEMAASLDTREEEGPERFSAVDPIEPALQDPQVLIGIADEILAEKIQEAAQADNLQILRAGTSQDVLGMVRSTRLSLVILDDGEVGGQALETCRAIRDMDTDHTSDLPVVIVADADSDAGADAGVTDWLIQPFTAEYARTRVRAWVMRSICRWGRAPIPENEPQRIETLKQLHLLDTDIEERFEQITRIAAAAFDVPMALVTLVDQDRQWFKSHFGLNATETPRDQAFCAHAILDTKVMIVRDTLLDSRFADNPLVVREPRIRFYAGYPLTLPNGTSPGTLCLIDTRPRDLDEVRIDLLRELGKMVEREMAANLRP